MSLINKFTIGFNNKERRKSLYLKNNTTLKVKEKQEEQQKQALSQELVEILITFGFELKQIMTAFREYKFTNIDEACYRLMKDNETGKYNHRFIPSEKDVENPNEIGDWSPENLAKNRERYYRQNEPWVLEGKTIGQWFDEKIKERNEQLQAA
jgi:hypothetical protein